VGSSEALGSGAAGRRAAHVLGACRGHSRIDGMDRGNRVFVHTDGDLLRTATQVMIGLSSMDGAVTFYAPSGGLSEKE
jgi:hypothetical protein